MKQIVAKELSLIFEYAISDYFQQSNSDVSLSSLKFFITYACEPPEFFCEPLVVFRIFRIYISLKQQYVFFKISSVNEI